MSEKLVFLCSACQGRIRYRSSQQGQLVGCPKCDAQVRVPSSSHSSATTSSAPSPAKPVPVPTPTRKQETRPPKPQTISVRCGHCSTAIEAPISRIGESVLCPDCHAPIPVERVETKRATANESDASQTRKAHRSLNGSVDSFGFSCSLCGTRLYASESQIGTQIACPDCHSQVEVLKHPRAAGSLGGISPPRLLDHDEISLEEVSERPMYQPTDTGKVSTRDMQVLRRPEQKSTGDSNETGPSSPDMPTNEERGQSVLAKRADFATVCPQCHARLGLRTDQIGKVVRCGDCQHKFMVRPRAES